MLHRQVLMLHRHQDHGRPVRAPTLHRRRHHHHHRAHLAPLHHLPSSILMRRLRHAHRRRGLTLRHHLIIERSSPLCLNKVVSTIRRSRCDKLEKTAVVEEGMMEGSI
ncbi:hypothetical protein COCNU_scaffold001177G000030 [Cocos nucifera]|nr:hypothetical protein [Cocos nucifera]